ncbi:thioredoxin-like isoform X2 [Molossus molossus]|uniref:thioredoxin-like isoform X2 n=1 Tax=Molossus molossus TaxID=27622 RepID=UPI001745E3C6|nr:thioredoxin-like isoform X2 [Molossus molossus]
MEKPIDRKYAFQEALNSAGDKSVVVDFSATWCGPCEMIKPFFHFLSNVAAECEVKCMPTFHQATFQFFKRGQKVGEFSEANKEELEATINELV